MRTSSVFWSLSALLLVGVSLACKNDGGDSDTDTGQSVTEGGPPVFLEFSATRDQIHRRQTVSFVAVLTDPDGVDDLIGGSLRDSEGASYGSFQSAAQEGSYELELTWEDIDGSRTIDLDSQGVGELGLYEWAEYRTFRAVFYDQAGNEVEQSATLVLECEEPTDDVCDGDGLCDPLDRTDRCGDCNYSCRENRPPLTAAWPVYYGEEEYCADGGASCNYTVRLDSGYPVAGKAPPTCDQLCGSMACTNASSGGASIECSGPARGDGEEYYSMFCYCSDAL